MRDRIIDQVKARTGRDLTVAGATSLSFFPRLAVALSDVSLSPPEGLEAPPTLVVPTVEAEIRPWSLLTAQPTVDRITLHRPTIELSVDAQGGRSWDFAGRRSRRSRPAPGSSDVQQPSGEPLPANETPAARAALSKLVAGSVRIVDGTVRYSDHGSGSRSEVEALNLTLAADDPSGPLKVNGSLMVLGAPLTIAGSVTSMQALLSDQPAQIALQSFRAAFRGHLRGRHRSGSRPVRRWHAQTPGPIGTGPGRLARPASAVERGWGRRSTLNRTQGDAKPGGTFKSPSQSRPLHNGRFARAGYSAAAPALERQSAGLGTGFWQTARQAQAATTQLRPCLPCPPPRCRQPRRRRASAGATADGATIPLNLSILGLLDANLTVSAQRLIHKEIKTGPARFTVALDGGIARLALEEVDLYGGRARGLLTLDGSGDVLVASNQPNTRPRCTAPAACRCAAVPLARRQRQNLPGAGWAGPYGAPDRRVAQRQGRNGQRRRRHHRSRRRQDRARPAARAAAEPDALAGREDALQRAGRQPSPSPTVSPETRT